VTRGTAPGPRGPVDPRLWARTTAVRPFLVGAAVVGTALAGLVVAQAWLLASAVGRVFATSDAGPALSLAPALAAVFLGRGLLTWLSSVLAQRASAAVKSQFRRDILRARLERPGSTVDAATLTVTVTQGLDALDGYVARYLPQLVLATTVPLVVGAALLATDWRTAVVVGLTLPLVPVFMALVGWLTQRQVERRWRVQSRLAHHFADLVAGLPTLQVFGRARAQATSLERIGEEHRRETMLTLRTSFLSSLVLELLATLSVALVAVGVGLRVVDGDLTLTTALFVLVLAPEAYLPLRQVGSLYHDSADGLAAVTDAFALIDGVPPVRADVGEVPDLATSTIELVGVSARHPEAGTDAVDAFDLVVGPGETVALTGPSGAGKSTALSVLLGFLDPSAGRVLVAGQDLRVLDPAAWRASLAWVPQAPALLVGSVGDNVALGAPAAPRSRVRLALDRAGAVGLELDREVGPGNEGLSAGEVRRVALARALLRIDCGGGQLLVMDEPTAGLDPDAELAALAGVRSLGVGAVVVSHRDAVLAAADRVVSVDAPSVVAP